jgi:hypothetical protein
MNLEAAPTPKASGLKTALDTVLAPKEAFESLRRTPTWGWALLVTIVLLAAGFALQRPAAVHAQAGTTRQMLATSPFLAGTPPETKQRMIERALHPSAVSAAIGFLSLLAVLFIACLFNALILLGGTALGEGTATFATLWAGSVNIAIPTLGLGALTLGIICTVRGPDAFATTAEMMHAVPGLALLAPGATGALAGFLGAISVFTLWGFALNVLLMRTAAGVKNAAAWIFPLIITLLGGSLGVIVGSFTG